MTTGLLAALYAVVRSARGQTLGQDRATRRCREFGCSVQLGRIPGCRGDVRGVGLQRFLGVMSVAAAAVLLIIGDIHGGAATIGTILGAILAPGVVSSQGSPETSRSGRQQ